MATYKIDSSKEKVIRGFLATAGFEFSDCAHAFWRAKKESIGATFYHSGKFLIQGKLADSLANDLVEKGFLASGVSANSWMGTDEAGKGDYFGPIVFAGCLMTKSVENDLLKAGVGDSKGLSDKRIAVLAQEIKTFCLWSAVVVSPPKYNELIAKMKNLNSLMGWGHARVIENILSKKSCEHIVSDKFGNEKYIINALGPKGKSMKLIQRTKGESDLAVAAASIIARDTFVKHMDRLSQECGMTIPKGAGAPVLTFGKEFVTKFGKEELNKYAKVHFKTTQQII